MKLERFSVGAMAKVACPAHDFSFASNTEVVIDGLTRANLDLFWSVSSSRCASTQALAELPLITPLVTADNIMVLPAAVGATPSVLRWMLSAARLRSTKSFWRGRSNMARPHFAQVGRTPAVGAGRWVVGTA